MGYLSGRNVNMSWLLFLLEYDPSRVLQEVHGTFGANIAYNI